MADVSMEGWGSDLPAQARPGVPREWSPRPDPGAHWELPERQVEGEVTLEREGVPRITPVFGTAQPAHGLSGVLRRRAYRRPDYLASHWLMLMLADRVDAFGARTRRLRPYSLTGALGAVALLVIRELRKT